MNELRVDEGMAKNVATLTKKENVQQIFLTLLVKMIIFTR